MQTIAWAFYGVLTVIYLALAGFIVFHILRYSLNRSNAIAGASLFIIVFGILFIANFTLFSVLPLDTLFNSSSLLPRANGF